MQFRWKYGGRKVCSAVNQRGGNTTKSRIATPGLSEGTLNTGEMNMNPFFSIIPNTTLNQ